MSADAYFSPPDPRHELLKAAQGEELRDRKVVKLLRSVLVEDLYGGTTVRALSWCRDSYNDAHCMHPVLDLAPVGSKGKVWLGSVKASSNADLLEQNQILYIWPASYNPRQTQDLRKFRILPVTDGTGVMASDLELQPIMDRMLDVAQKVLQQGLSLLVCCKNGAHRSSFMLLLLLMFMSGRRPGEIAHYMQRVRNIVDVWSNPPGRPHLNALDFCNKHYERFCNFRIAKKFPAIALNDVVSADRFREIARDLGVQFPRVLPAPLVLTPAPGQGGSTDAVTLTPSPKAAKGKGKSKGRTVVYVPKKAAPPPSPTLPKSEQPETEAAGRVQHAAPSVEAAVGGETSPQPAQVSQVPQVLQRQTRVARSRVARSRARKSRQRPL